MERKKLGFFKRVKFFYDSQDTIDEKLFWSVMPMTVIVGMISAIGTVLEKLGAFAVICGFSCLIVPLILGVLCYFFGNCQKFYVAFCLLLNCILMPLTFLANGGLMSGMPMYCVGLLTLCAFCSRKKDRIITFLISMAAYLAVFISSEKFPQIVVPIRDSLIRTDIILSFCAAAVSLLAIISTAIEEYNTQRYKEVNNGLIDLLGSIIEFRSLETGSHARNVKKITEIMLKTANKYIEEANFSKSEINMISSAAVLHDIGKIAVPDAILNKPGKLTKEEFEVIKRHPVDGSEMIKSMEDYQNRIYFEYCYVICRFHHEWYDGSGYPDRLKGEEIPLIAQVASVADVLEALTTKRVYKDAYSLDEAYEIIKSECGTHYSERMIGCFEKAWPDLKKYLSASKKVS